MRQCRRPVSLPFVFLNNLFWEFDHAKSPDNIYHVVIPISFKLHGTGIKGCSQVQAGDPATGTRENKNKYNISRYTYYFS